MAKKKLKPVYPSLREVLVAKKAMSGLTSDDLAKLTGLGKSTIGAYLGGTRKPNLVSAVLISKALGMDLDDLANTNEVKGSMP